MDNFIPHWLFPLCKCVTVGIHYKWSLAVMFNSLHLSLTGAQRRFSRPWRITRLFCPQWRLLGLSKPLSGRWTAGNASCHRCWKLLRWSSLCNVSGFIWRYRKHLQTFLISFTAPWVWFSHICFIPVMKSFIPLLFFDLLYKQPLFTTYQSLCSYFFVFIPLEYFPGKGHQGATASGVQRVWRC